MTRTLCGALLACSIAACAGTPRARTLDELRELASSPGVRAARADAPEPFARAERARARAEAALRNGERADAEEKAEIAAAEYRRVVALARAIGARRRLDRAREAARQAQMQTQRFESLRRETDAEVEQILRRRAASEALAAERAPRPGTAPRPAPPQAKLTAEELRRRQVARRQAARGLLAEARVFLLAAVAISPSGAAERHLQSARRAEHVASEADRRGDVSALIEAAGEAREEAVLAIRAAGEEDEPSSTPDGLRPAGSTPDGGRPTARRGLRDREDALFAAATVTAAFEVRRDARGVVLTLRGLFAPRGTRWVAAARPLLEAAVRLARQFAEPPALPLLVEGYADEPMAREALARLSLERAEAVAAELRRAGVPAERLRTAGLGPDAPVAPSERPEGRALNNRIEIVFVSAVGR